jgi:hypothetical protein
MRKGLHRYIDVMSMVMAQMSMKAALKNEAMPQSKRLQLK